MPLFDGYVLAATAGAHLCLGDRANALGLADEAIEVCRRRGTRLGEFSALLSRIHALRELQDVEATKLIEATLAEADAWLEMSGAKSYEPFLHVERAELAKLTGDAATRERGLREAHRLFLEIDAPIRGRGGEGTRAVNCSAFGAANEAEEVMSMGRPSGRECSRFSSEMAALEVALERAIVSLGTDPVVDQYCEPSREERCCDDSERLSMAGSE